MGKRSFTGPWTLVTGGSSLGEGSATMDQTYVPAGTQIPAWRTMMGTSVDGRFMVKRKQASRLPHGLFPYVLALFLNAFAGRILRLWSLGGMLRLWAVGALCTNAIVARFAFNSAPRFSYPVRR